jgi:hypothetical protein
MKCRQKEGRQTLKIATIKLMYKTWYKFGM